MSVDTTTRKQEFTMDGGVTKAFTFTFAALRAVPTDIKCKKINATGTVSTLAYTTDYTAVVNVDGDGGVVTVVDSSGTDTLFVYRDTTDTQESDYEDFNQFPADTVEKDIDRRALKSQELDDDISRAVKFAITSDISNIDFPTPVDGKGIKWSGTGGTIVNTTLDVDSASTLAASSATVAQVAATASSVSATAASLSATTASTQALVATTQATLAASSATLAMASATAASVSQVAAASSATVSAAAEVAASSHATVAAKQAGIATTQATIATTQATIATTQATIATTQATIATTQATIASSHATTALGAATDAGSHSTVALEQAAIATTQATIATTQATIATTQATLAASSATVALAASRTVGTFIVTTSETVELSTIATLNVTTSATIELLTVATLTVTTKATIANTIYLDLNADIEAEIAAATAGDTIVLAAGTYTIIDNIDIAQSINLVGQGIGQTTILCETAGKTMIAIAASDVRIANMSFRNTAATSKCIYSSGDRTNVNVENILITMTAGNRNGISYLDTSGVVRDAIILMPTGAGLAGCFQIQNNGTPSYTVDCFNVVCIGYSESGTAFGFQNYDAGGTGDSILNLYDCVGIATDDGTAIPYGIMAAGGTDSFTNVYGGTYSGADGDLHQADGATLTVYGCTLANGTTNGTVTYASSSTLASNKFYADGTVTDTNFKKGLTIGALTIYISDGTVAEGNLTGVKGDICLNGASGTTGSLAICDANGTNWTDL